MGRATFSALRSAIDMIISLVEADTIRVQRTIDSPGQVDLRNPGLLGEEGAVRVRQPLRHAPRGPELAGMELVDLRDILEKAGPLGDHGVRMARGIPDKTRRTWRINRNSWPGTSIPGAAGLSSPYPSNASASATPGTMLKSA